MAKGTDAEAIHHSFGEALAGAAIKRAVPLLLPCSPPQPSLYLPRPASSPPCRVGPSSRQCQSVAAGCGPFEAMACRCLSSQPQTRSLPIAPPPPTDNDPVRIHASRAHHQHLSHLATASPPSPRAIGEPPRDQSLRLSLIVAVFSEIGLRAELLLLAAGKPRDVGRVAKLQHTHARPSSHESMQCAATPGVRAATTSPFDQEPPVSYAVQAPTFFI